MKIVVLTGAGISAESGLRTFRDSDGLWENYRIEEVATPEAFARNPELVLRFYNDRRRLAQEVQPNEAHYALAVLEDYHEVTIITQNVDDLHERAGSKQIIHLHGELRKVRSVNNPRLIKDIGGEAIQLGDLAEDGGQWRPHIVWFGEAVPMMDAAVPIMQQADVVLVVGTSLQVYPAAGLVLDAPSRTPVYVIDPKASELSVNRRNVTYIPEKATVGVPQVVNELIKNRL